MPKTKEKFIIIDGNALVHRAFHALPPLTTKDGKLVNAVYGFTTILLKIIKDLKPDYLACAFDREGKTFRHEEFKEYKAQRIKQPDELYEQIPIIEEILKVFQIPVIDSEKPGFEADDVIGTVINKLKKEGKELKNIIVTGDLDTLQLIDDHTEVFTLKKGISDTITYDERVVKERYGLTPKQLIDFKALRGDPSDNIPGVKGIGEKTAAQLIKEFGSLENLYKNLNSKKIKDRVRELLKGHQGKAFLSKKLATIIQDVPLKFDLSKTKIENYNLQEVYDLFQKLGFKSLLNRLPTMVKKIETSKTAKAETSPNIQATLGLTKNIKKDKFNYQLLNENNFSSFLNKLKEQKEIAVDTETTSLDPWQSQVLGISFCWQKEEAYFLPVNKKTYKLIKDVKQVLENEKIKLIGHNLKFDYENLLSLDIKLNNLYFDTLIAAYLLSKVNRSLKLDDLVFSELGYKMLSIEELTGEVIKKNIKIETVPLEKLSWYACEDADFTFRLYQHLKKDLDKENLMGLFQNLEMPLIEVLATMEKNGVLIDANFLKKMEKKITLDIKALKKKIYKLAGKEFNIASPLQLKEILFDKLNISTQGLKKIKTGVSTAAGELEKMKDLHPVIPFILEYRELTKLQSTYISALPQLINKKTGRVHTSFNQTVTATGRLSSSNPNLQNIPIRTDLGSQIRQAFIAPKGYKIISADYSQIELRIIASLANDQKMIGSFQRGEDIHKRTASEIFKCSLDEVDAKMRRAAKTINFGIIYGMGAWGLSESAEISRDEAKDFIDRYFSLHQDIKNYIEDAKEQVHRLGFVETLFGRRRYLPDINSGVQVLKAAAERMAINMPIQGCLPAHVRILTSRGYLPIGELYRNKNKPKYAWDGSNWKKFKTLNRGRSQLAQIIFSNGQIFDCDTRHQILTVTDNGYLWKNFNELKINDKICFSFPQIIDFKEKIKNFTFSYNKNKQHFSIKNLDKNFWYWLGYYYGDGHFTKRQSTRATRYDFSYYFGYQKKRLLIKCQNYFKKLGLNPRLRIVKQSTRKGQNKWELQITSIGFGKFLEKLGLTPNESAKTKKLLVKIFQENVENRIAFIKGFFDADGNFNKNYKYLPNFHLCQREILQDLQILLRTLGVEGYLNGPYHYKKQISYRLDMLRNSFIRIYYQKNQKPSYRNSCLAPRFIIKEILKFYPNLSKKFFRNNSDYVIYSRWKNDGYSTIHHLVEWLKRNNLKIMTPIYSWNQIKKIKKLKKDETTFTLSIEGSHRFDSEGIISKNTAADLIKLAMIKIQKELPKISQESKMLLQVHDELVFEVPEKEVKKVANLIKDVMENIYKLRAPIKVGVEAGDNWGETEKI